MSAWTRAAIVMACLVALAVTSALAGEHYEYMDYEVKKGDTLWDISQDKLKDPFNWPIVWKENPMVANPDVISPGQIIRIPTHLLKQSVVIPKPQPVEPEPVVQEAPKPKKPMGKKVEPRRARVISADDIMSAGYISPEIPGVGRISGSPFNRIIFGPGEEVYIKSGEPVSVGQRFYVVRPDQVVYHPGQGHVKLGHLIRIQGVLEVVKVGKAQVSARIVKFFDTVSVGDLIEPYFKVEPVVLSGNGRAPEVDAMVIGSNNMRKVSSLFDVVYIDAGQDAQLKVGDVVMTLAPGTPDRPNGILQLVGVRGTTASAVIVDVQNHITLGDQVVGIPLK